MRLTQVEIQKYFGEAIRIMRKEVGISQEKFALAAEINRTYYGNIERGEENVTLSMIMRLCNFLDKSPSEIFVLIEKLATEQSSKKSKLRQ